MSELTPKPRRRQLLSRQLLRFIRRRNQNVVRRSAVFLLALLFTLIMVFVPPRLPIAPTSLPMVGLILLILMTFVPLRKRLEAYLDNIWHPERNAYQQIVEDYSRVIRDTSDLLDILSYVSRTLSQALYAESVWVWLYHQESETLVLTLLEGSAPANAPHHPGELPMDIDLTAFGKAQTLHKLPESALKQGLGACQIDVVAVLGLRDELIGLLCLGPQILNEPYSQDALALLDALAGQSALAVKNARLIADLEESVTNLTLAYRRTIDAQEEERRSLAVEIHDDILGRLTTMTLTLRNCKLWMHKKPEQTLEWLEHAEAETQSINQRLREITQGLHPTVLTDLGLVAALQAYLDTLARQPWGNSAPHTITLTTQGFNGHRLDDPRLERDIYSLTRQALDNAIKHAHADTIFIHLQWEDKALSITVQDTGKGLRDKPEVLMGQNGRLGLLSMSERARAWNGRLTFSSTPGKGTTIRASIPVDLASQDPTALQVFNQYLTRVEGEGSPDA